MLSVSLRNLNFSELCIDTNCPGDTCQTSHGNVVCPGLHLTFSSVHSTNTDQALTVFPRTADNTADTQGNWTLLTGVQRPVKAAWQTKNFKICYYFKTWTVLQGAPRRTLGIFPSRGPFELDLKVYTGVHQKK